MSARQQKALFLESKCGQFAVRATAIPEPSVDEVLIRVEASALNPSDWKIQQFGMVVEEFPTILGWDAAGTVVRVGSAIQDQFAVGNRVIVQGWFTDGGRSAHGTYRQYLAARPNTVAKISQDFPLESAASLPSGLVTAAFSLFNEKAVPFISLYDGKESSSSVKLTPPWEARGRGLYTGKPIFVLGGASTVGQFVIQLAKLAGFAPIITTASLHNVKYLKSLGATHVLERSVGQGHLRAEIMRIAGGPLALAYDAISRDESFALSYGVTAPTGELIIVSPGVFPAENRKKVHLANGLFNSPVNKDVGESLRMHLKDLLEARDVKVSLSTDANDNSPLNRISLT
ncbi:Protein TOXD [Trametes pubescens]|uniref:Protein TOXD n=1 Tax=Trametes pubescens TaxID=154538 RepID=A0A1M2VMB0_TRAPU|nr:Protein TOXD [Trametes pubescens]